MYMIINIDVSRHPLVSCQRIWFMLMLIRFLANKTVAAVLIIIKKNGFNFYLREEILSFSDPVYGLI